MKNNNKSLLITILSGSIFCFVLFGISLIFSNKSTNYSKNEMNLGDSEHHCATWNWKYKCFGASQILSGNGCYEIMGTGGPTSEETCNNANGLWRNGSCYARVTNATAVEDTCRECEAGYELKADGTCSSAMCTNTQYWNGSSCESCPSQYPNSEINSTGSQEITKCYLTTSTGKYVPVQREGEVDCPSNAYSNGGERVYYGATNSCIECPSNASANETRTGCTCNSGYIMNNDTNQCIPDSGCSDNQYKNSSNTCSTCEAGYYCNGTSRTACPENTYSAGGATECTNCPAHSTAQGVGNTVCTCISGYEMKNGSCVKIETTDCPIGSYRVGNTGNNSVDCVTCQPGYYASETNPTCHIDVPAGSYLENATGIDVKSCPAGTYSLKTTVNYGETSSCTNCPYGYSSPIGATSSSQCYSTTSEDDCTVTATTEANSGLVSYNSHFYVHIDISGRGCNGQTMTFSVTRGTSSATSNTYNVSDGQGFNFTVDVDEQSSCESTTIATATLSGGESDSVTVNTYRDWHQVQTNVCVSDATINGVVSRTIAENRGVIKYYIENNNTKCPGQKQVDVWVRGCASGEPVVEPTYACYADNADLTKATQAEWQTGPTTQLPYKINGINNPDDCKTTPVVEPTYACYADNADLTKATKAEWQTGPTTQLPYKINGINNPDDCKTTPVVNPTYACYADNADLTKATQAEWQTGPTTQLPYKIDGINRPDDCRTVTVVNPTYACYANDTDLTKATQAEWQTGPTTQLPYKINGISNSNDCRITPIVPHCYIDDNGLYQWTPNPNPSWKIVSGVTKKSDCKENEEPACYLTPSGDYDWGLHAKDSGYTLITSITNQSSCVKPTVDYACYKDANNNYVWDTAAPSGYTKVDTITNPKDCAPDEEPACYVHDDDFIWGKYEKVTGYIKIENITDEANCDLPEEEACYVDKNGKYVWGQYKDDKDYKLVSSITEMSKCTNNVVVPSTGISASRLIYIVVAILMACGIGFIYYSTTIKKNN